MEILKSLSILDVIGYVEAIIVTIVLFYGAVLWWRGILPVIIRLGNGLAKRKIAIFATSNNAASLRSLLADSTLFKEKNICVIPNEGDIGKAEKASVYLVYWADWKEQYKEILNAKRDGCALIIYAPPPEKIPFDAMNELEKKRNTIVTNFRGRLLNDIVVTMITTDCNRK